MAAVSHRCVSTGAPVHTATRAATARVPATTAAPASHRRTSSGRVPITDAPSHSQVGHRSVPTGPTSGTDSTAAATNAAVSRRRVVPDSQGVTAP